LPQIQAFFVNALKANRNHGFIRSISFNDRQISLYDRQISFNDRTHNVLRGQRILSLVIGPLPNLTKRYEPVFTRLAVVKVSLRLASYQHVPSPP
jgi:hypothetical protein